MNGQGPETGWYGLFTPGERVRLRVINAAAMSYFSLRIPGLPMTVVQTDGQNVEPVTVDELQIAVAETYDVVVEPVEDRPYTVFAEAMDRSGYARGTLAPREGMQAAVPELREPPLRTMVDMGMAMDGMAMEVPAPAGTDRPGMEPGLPEAAAAGDGMQMAIPTREGMADMTAAGPVVARHGPDTHGPGNAGVAEVQRNRLGEPGTGLQGVGHRVLVYTDLRAHEPYNQRPPDREVELHLTGNMERYMWSFDGVKFSEVREPIPFEHGERVRLTLVNDTMMEHPIHLHGMWMELEAGQGEYLPRKHTINVKPAERLSALINADAPGRWAFHCHLVFHRDMGMFRVVEVSPYEGERLMRRLALCGALLLAAGPASAQEMRQTGAPAEWAMPLLERQIVTFVQADSPGRARLGGREGLPARPAGVGGQDASVDGPRTHAVVGVQGLAPYWFEIDAVAFVSHTGDVTASVEAEYELLFTQRRCSSRASS